MTPRLSDRSFDVRSSQIRDLLRLTQPGDMLSLAGGLPAPEVLPRERVLMACDRVLSASPGRPHALQYGPTEGHPALREVIAAQAGVDVGQVMITTGSQQALTLLAQVLADPGEFVAAADPTYLGALQAFRFADLTLATGAWQSLFEGSPAGRRPGAAFGYVVPDFDNPTGRRWSVEERSVAAGTADAFGTPLIEDRPYAELAFDGDAVPSLSTFGSTVIRVGSASKVIAPGLRVGWIIGPESTIAAATRLKQCLDLHTSSLDQAIVAEMLADTTWWSTHVRALRAAYRQRAAALAGALEQHLGHRFAFERPTGGMFIWGRFPDSIDSRQVFHAAIDEGVAFVPGVEFAVSDPARLRSFARLSFATLAIDELDEAARRLAVAVRRVVARREEPAGASSAAGVPSA